MLNLSEKKFRTKILKRKNLKITEFFRFVNFFFFKLDYKLILSILFSFLFSIINIVLITSVYNKIAITFFQSPKTIDIPFEVLNSINKYYLLNVEKNFTTLFILVIFLYIIISITISYINITIGNNILFFFRSKLIKNIFDSNIDQVHKIKDSKVGYVYIATINRLKAFPNYFTKIISSSLVSIFLFYQLLLIDLNLTLILFVVAIFFILITLVVQKLLQKYHLRFITGENLINSYITEIQNSIIVFKQLLNKKIYLKNIFKILNQSIFELKKYSVLSNLSLSIIVLFFYSFLIIFFLSVSSGYSYEIKNIFLFAILALALARMVIHISENTRGLVEVFLNYKITNETINFKKDNKIRQQKNINLNEINNLKLQKINIKFKDQKKFLFKNLNLNFQKNKMYALIGKSGEGKTSILNVISGFFGNDIGKVKINNIDISLLNRFKFINYVTQEPVIIKGTLLDNLNLYSNVKTKSEINKYLKIVDFFNVKKFTTFLDSKGSNLSGGQKQKIAIARALLSNAKIFLFDEIFSNIDTESEVKILKNIKKQSKNKIMIFITHNLKTLKYFDEILFVEKGKVEVFNSLNEFFRKR